MSGGSAITQTREDLEPTPDNYIHIFVRKDRLFSGLFYGLFC
jgi:hypothetical protein